MKKLLFAILLLALISASNILKSQVIPKDIVERVNLSTYIFEGTVIQSTSYWNANTNFIYTSAIVETRRLFKGNLTCGTVELIFLGGCVDGKCVDLDHNLILREGSKGIFMCVETGREESSVDFYQETNYQKLETIFNEQGYIEFSSDGIGQDVIDYWQFQLPDLADAYKMMELYTQLNYIDCNPSPIPLLTDTQITFTLQNNHLTTYNGVKAFEFDISLSDNMNGIYFLNSSILLEYDTNVFSSYISASNQIHVTPAPLLSVNYPYINTSNNSQNVVRIVVSNAHPSNPNFVGPYATLSSTPTPALHVVMEIKDCDLTDSIFPRTDIGVTDSRYTLNPMDDAIGPKYDNRVAGGGVKFTGCGPRYISSISPHIVNAGVGDIVTVTGLGFGFAGAPGKLFLRNANRGGSSYCYLDTVDYISWDNALITFVVPSIVDSVGRSKVPGTGIVKIMTASGDSIEELNDSLIIYYGVANTRFIDSLPTPHIEKVINHLTPSITSPLPGGYLIRTDTSFSNHTDRMACLEMAIKQWTCLTTVNFTLGTDTVLDNDTGYTANDKVCFFKFWEFPPDDSMTLAKTSQWTLTGYDSCNSGFATEFDLRVNSRYTNRFVADTNKTNGIDPFKIDLYQILLHELGHCHSLTHVNNPKAVMWYANEPSTSAGVSAVNRRVKLWEDGQATDGGLDIVQRSYVYDSVHCSGAFLRMTSGSTNCTNVIGITELEMPDIKLFVYPNPATTVQNVSYETDKMSMVSVTLFDLSNRIVYLEESIEMEGKHEKKISLEMYESGFYFIKISVGKNSFISKIVKQ
jgi:hypothetical protein